MSLDLIYSMRRKPLKCEPPNLEKATDPESPRPLVVLSIQNIIAFSSLTELCDTDGDSWGGHVYVCDLDTPWESHKVTSTIHPVSSLEWDCEGQQLVVCTSVGEVSVFAQKDYLLNSWTCLYNATFPGEHIVSSIFFHNGRRLMLLEKKGDVPISDKIQVLRPQPTAKGFGGTPQKGVCIVTTTGLVATIIPPLTSGDSARATITSHCVTPARDRVYAAATAHKNGNILIAALCSSGVRAGICGGDTLSLSPLPALLCDTSQAVSVAWSLRDDGDYLLISGSSVSLWKLTEMAHPVHKMLSKGPLQGSTTPGGGTKPNTECFSSLWWQQSWMVGGGGAGGVVTRCSARGALAAVCSHTHAAVWAHDHHHMSTRTINTVNDTPLPAGTPPKKPKYGSTTKTPPTLQSCCISTVGNVVVCIDSHTQLHVLLYQPYVDIPVPALVQQVNNSLQYCAVGGYDCLSVLMGLKAPVLDALFERFSETLQRQPAPFQQFYFNTWLKIRIAIAKMRAPLATVYHWLRCSQGVFIDWAAVSAVLRTEDEKLNALLTGDANELDKALSSLERAESAPDPAVCAAAAACRRSLQRAADTAVTAAAAATHTPGNHHQYTIWSDGAAITVLRKLVAVAALSRATRMPESLPRLLAKLPYSAHSADLLEECAILSAQTTTRVWESLPRCDVTSPHGATEPYILEYGVEPKILRYVPEPPPAMQSDSTPTLEMDSIRYTYLGGGAAGAGRWRRCGRCGGRALPPPPPPPPANPPPGTARPAPRPHRHRHYHHRFLKQCRCGGQWTLISNV